MDIIHAGTFFGDFLPALARSRKQDGLVWAFEPGSENCRCAAITILLNGLVAVRLTEAALGAEPGSGLLATMNREGVALGGASRLLKDESNASLVRTERVELVTVDQIVPEDRRVAVLQLDVEGHERQALAGAMLTIARCRPLLVLEASAEADWIPSMLGPLGYRIERQVEANIVLRCG